MNGPNYVTAAKLMHTSNVTSANAVSQSHGSEKTSKVVSKADVILPAPVFATSGGGITGQEAQLSPRDRAMRRVN